MSDKAAHPSGLLNINKPKGITSHDVVVRVRKLTGQRKAGHAGTLDPMASGVLLVCLGQATRLIEYLMPGRKQYRATIRFGIATDTHDAEGNIVAKRDPTNLTEPSLHNVLPAFLGEIEQTPPVISAIKKDGQPLYKRVRAGETVKVEPRRVTIDSIDWVSWRPPDLTLDIVCSAGTYIRSVARDIGEAVGVGAHLAELTRTASGSWSLDQAISLTTLEGEAAKDKDTWQKHLHSPDQAITHLPRVTLDEQTVTRVSYGQRVRLESVETGSDQAQGAGVKLIRAYTPGGELLAILTLAEPGDKLWQPKKVFRGGRE